MQLNCMFFIMKSKRLLLICSLLIITSVKIYGQVNDAGLWASINIDKKLSSKFSIGFSEEVRFNENISEVGTVFSEIAAGWKFNKFFSASAGYRFILKRDASDFYSKRHRFLINVNAKIKKGRFNLAARARFQSQYSDVYSSDQGATPADYLRTRVTVKYEPDKKYTPFLSAETFFHLNNADGILFDNYRISGGIEYAFNKKYALDFYYLLDREINVNNAWTSYITGIAFNISL
jgi:hypothetical protein